MLFIVVVVLVMDIVCSVKGGVSKGQRRRRRRVRGESVKVV